MSGVVERVAKAIYMGRNGHGAKAWGSLPRAHKEPYIADARAAIEAMKYQDGWDEDLFVKVACKKRLEVISSIEFWDDVIDEALK